MAGNEVGEVTLEINTVSFVVVAAKPVKEGDKVVVVDLIASVENHLRALPGQSVLRAAVHRDGRPVETTTLRQLDQLPLGITEAKLTYRPPTGFPPGDTTSSSSWQRRTSLSRPPISPASRSETVFQSPGAAAGATAALIAGFVGWRLLRRRRARRL